MSPRHIFVDAIVVRVYPYRDADLIIRLVAADLGKISALARNSRASKRRFGTSLDLFDIGTFELSRGKGSLLLVNSFQPKQSFRRVREDLDKLTLASLICEAFDNMLADAGPHLESSHSHVGYFERLMHALSMINEASNLSEALRAAFFGLVDLLHICGVLAEERAAPSSRSLMRLLSEIESHSEKVLETRSTTEALFQKLGTTTAHTASG